MKSLVKIGQHSDLFARHVAKTLPKEEANPQYFQAIIDFEIIWQANPISCVETFKTNACRLCTKEHLEIPKLPANPDNTLIDYGSELFGSCRHNPKFHRFWNTGESLDKKVTPIQWKN
eukprot:3148463-Ditylum_brightwellii.AAC.1